MRGDAQRGARWACGRACGRVGVDGDGDEDEGAGGGSGRGDVRVRVRCQWQRGTMSMATTTMGRTMKRTMASRRRCFRRPWRCACATHHSALAAAAAVQAGVQSAAGNAGGDEVLTWPLLLRRKQIVSQTSSPEPAVRASACCGAGAVLLLPGAQRVRNGAEAFLLPSGVPVSRVVHGV